MLLALSSRARTLAARELFLSPASVVTLLIKGAPCRSSSSSSSQNAFHSSSLHHAARFSSSSSAWQQQQRQSSQTGKGELPKDGPARDALTALPFAVTPAAAEAAFERFHAAGKFSLPRHARACKESFLPFWLGDADVAVEVTGAEVGRDEVVSRYDPRTGRRVAQFETVWRRVELAGMAWTARHAPEDAAMQLYAAYKYGRADVERLRPGPLVAAARPITPDMLRAAAGPADGGAAGDDTRRVGAFVMTPETARRILKGRIEAAELRRAEAVVSQATGMPRVRFVQLKVEFLGGGGGGPRLSPAYVPFFVFSWRHGGVKVHTFVSGADARAAGAQYVDDGRVSVLATAAAAGALFFTGAAAAMTPLTLFAAAVAIPYLSSTFIARWWPAVRHLWQAASGRFSQAWHDFRSGGAGRGAGVWSAEYVGRYDAAASEAASSAYRQRQHWREGHEGGAGRGAADDDAESFADFVRDPLGWVERELHRQRKRAARQQQQQQPGGNGQWGPGEQARAEREWREQQAWRQQRRTRSSAGGGGGHSSSPRDPAGYYRALGVPPTASPHEVSEAFRGLALRHHPDRAAPANKDAATARFQAIAQAYHVLRDPGRRAAYDATGRG